MPDAGILQTEIMNNVPYAKVGFSKAIVAGWIKLDKSSGKPMVTKNVPCIDDTTQSNLKNVNSLSDNIKVEYKKRKLLQELYVKFYLTIYLKNIFLKILNVY